MVFSKRLYIFHGLWTPSGVCMFFFRSSRAGPLDVSRPGPSVAPRVEQHERPKPAEVRGTKKRESVELSPHSAWPAFRIFEEYIFNTIHPPETNSLPLNMDGWKITFLLGRHIFRVELLVSGRVFSGKT